jgi:hypothetical protein
MDGLKLAQLLGATPVTFTLRPGEGEDVLGYAAKSEAYYARTLQAICRRARPHCRLAPPLTRFIPDPLTYSVLLFPKRQCDRTLE